MRAPFWLARLLDGIAEWLFLVWLLVSAWALTADAHAPALVLAAWLLARPVLALVGARLAPLSGRRATTALALARTTVIVLSILIANGRLEVLVVAALAFGGFTAWGGASRPAAVRRLFGGTALSLAGGLDALIARIALVVGAALAAPLMLISPPLAAWAAVVALAAAWLVAVALVDWERRGGAVRGPDRDAAATVNAHAAPRADSARSAGASRFRPLDQPRAPTILAAGGGAGLLVGGLIALLPELAAVHAGEAALAGIGLAAVGVGALMVRLPIGRLRLHLPPVLVPGLLVLVMAIAALVVAVGGLAWLAVPLLVLLGSVGVALDTELLVRLRRLGDSGPAMLRALVATVAGGQLVGAGAVALLGGRLGEIAGPITLLAVAACVLQGVGLVLDRGAIAGARHQVQQFSWAANPPARPAEPYPQRTRAGRLAGWIGRQVETELVDVTLPQSGRRYAIARPSGDGRDSLFEAAKRDPERQMPFWAKVWPSGVALSDVVVERAAEVRGQQVLELGAGLGVTACTVLEEGGDIVTADYSLLPLALCRLNGLANTGRAPGSICFNWRDEEQVREVLRRHPPIGLILAADVLYEGRDVEPLIGVIESLLAADGSLWLAEPVRKTAQRFLDRVAALGWQVESRTIRADWPDATSGRVNVHAIRRDQSVAEAALGLGAWQL